MNSYKPLAKDPKGGQGQRQGVRNQARAKMQSKVREQARLDTCESHISTTQDVKQRQRSESK